MRSRTVRTLLIPLFALLLSLLAAPPSPAAQPQAPSQAPPQGPPQASPEAPLGAPHVTKQKYAGYLFAYFTGEGTADGEQIRYALSRGNDPLHWRELNGGQAGAHLHDRREGPARPVRDPLPRGRQVLHDRDRSAHVPELQRQLGRRPAPRQQVHHGLGVHRPGPLDRPAPGEGVSGQRGQHLGAGGLLGRHARRVRRLLGVQAVRRRRPGPHRLHVQQDAVRDDEGLPLLQRAEGLGRPRLLGDRLNGRQAQGHLLPLHEGRAGPHLLQPLLEVHHRGEVDDAHGHLVRLRGGLCRQWLDRPG
jgi:hypothetical protein